jgi:hypothetical protein
MTMLNNTRKLGTSLTVVMVLGLAAACSRKGGQERTAAGAVDSAEARTTAITPAAGPGVQVTRTDAKSVTKATDYELTPENFAKFLAAADSVTAIEGRDAATRSHLSANLEDAGSTDLDAGLKWLESSDSVSKAINSAGISVRDYFVMSIATAEASRFMSDPKSAPGTPTLAKNAEFLRSHTADLAKLQAQREHKPVVTASP